MKLQKQWDERLRLLAERDKLWDEGDRLHAEGNKLWVDAIIETYGDIKFEWVRRDGVFDCELENGDVYRGDAAS